MQRVKVVALFLLAWIFAKIFWGFILGAGLIHHSDKPAIQGLAANGAN